MVPRRLVSVALPASVDHLPCPVLGGMGFTVYKVPLKVLIRSLNLCWTLLVAAIMNQDLQYVTSLEIPVAEVTKRP